MICPLRGTPVRARVCVCMCVCGVCVCVRACMRERRAFTMADTSYAGKYDSGCQTVFVFLTDGVVCVCVCVYLSVSVCVRLRVRLRVRLCLRLRLRAGTIHAHVCSPCTHMYTGMKYLHKFT